MAGGTKRHGRNKAKCLTYRNQDRQKKNAALRQERHLKRVAFFAARREASPG